MSAREELLRLYQRDGHLTPEQVLAEAQQPESPLHSMFEWDDTEAARRFRLHQARTLIVRCRVTIEVQPDRLIRARAFLHAPTEDHPGYAPIKEVMSDDRREFVLAQARRDIAALQQKYRDLIDLRALLGEMFEVPAA